MNSHLGAGKRASAQAQPAACTVAPVSPRPSPSNTRAGTRGKKRSLQMVHTTCTPPSPQPTSQSPAPPLSRPRSRKRTWKVKHSSPLKKHKSTYSSDEVSACSSGTVCSTNGTAASGRRGSSSAGRPAAADDRAMSAGGRGNKCGWVGAGKGKRSFQHGRHQKKYSRGRQRCRGKHTECGCGTREGQEAGEEMSRARR